MDLLFIVTSSAFFVWIIRNILFWLGVLQQHDYQFGRVRDYFTTTIQGRRVWLSPNLFLKVLAMLAFVPTVFDEALIDPYHSIIAGIFLINIGIFIKELATSSFKLPKFTPLATFFALPTLAVIILFYLNPIIDPYLWLLILERLLVIVILLLLFASAFPLEIYWDLKIRKARTKMQLLQHCYVIAVVGDSEKKATADMIGQIFANESGLLTLSNGPITKQHLADIILKQVTPDTRMIVTVFDSFEHTDLYELSQLLMPNVIVCTTLSESTLPTYQELFRLLPESVPVMLNTTHSQNRKLYKQMLNKTKKKPRTIIPYAVQYTMSDKNPDLSVIATSIQTKKLATHFSVSLDGKPYHFSVSLLGRYPVMNLLPGLYLGITSGIPLPEMKKIVGNLQPSQRHMVAYILQNNGIIIDNTAAESIDAIDSCVEYMRLYKGKKIVIYCSTSRLSKDSASEQYRIAKLIAQQCDHLFLVDRYFHKQIMKGLYETNSKCVVTYRNKYKIAGYLKKQMLQKHDIAVFIGNGSEKILHYVLKRVH